MSMPQHCGRRDLDTANIRRGCKSRGAPTCCILHSTLYYTILFYTILYNVWYTRLQSDWNTESARSAIYSIFSASGAYFDVSRQKYHILMFCDKKLFLNKTESRHARCMSSLSFVIYLPNTQLQLMPACDTSSFKLSQALWVCLQTLAWLVESLLRYSTLISPTIMYNIKYWTIQYTILYTIHYYI